MERGLLICFLSFFCCMCHAQAGHVLTADSKRKAGVEYGEHIYTRFADSKLFPGTIRDVDVYVPAQYDGRSPACVCVFQDGLSYRADTVVSNLIESKEIPVMILVAASPGWVVGDFDSDSPRSNRTYEYDTPSPRFGQFLLEELLPFVESLKTETGKSIILSQSRNDRMITGCSSGAACAFNVAWNTGSFSRVYSSCGSFTGLRGSYANATLVQKYEPKPIRFYFQSGTHDMWTSFGDWWSANQEMVRAMDFAGYDFSYKFIENAEHCDDNVTLIFPDAMRFLWKGYPQNEPAPRRKTRNFMLNQILVEDRNFELVYTDIEANSLLVSDHSGNVLLASSDATILLKGNTLRSVSDKKIIAVGKAHEMLVYIPRKGFEVTDSCGRIKKSIKSKMHVSHAVPLRDGGYYVVGKQHEGDHFSTIWYLSAGYELLEKENNLKSICTLALSGNNNWLYAFGYDTRRGYSYKVDRNDKSLLYGQEFFYIHLPDQCDGAEVTSAVCDDYGRTYLATASGIQVCDYNGRSEAILPLPGNAKPVSIAWGEEAMNVLYILCDNGNIYKRELNTKGTSLNAPMPIIRVGAG